MALAVRPDFEDERRRRRRAQIAVEMFRMVRTTRCEMNDPDADGGGDNPGEAADQSTFRKGRCGGNGGASACDEADRDY